MMEEKQFGTKLVDTVKTIFPKSHVATKLVKGHNNSYISLQFTLGADKSEYSSGIINNDPAYHSIMIDVNEDGTPLPKAKVHGGGNSGRIYIKSKNHLLVYDPVKTGWRDFTGDEQQIVKRLGAYFKNVKEVLLTHADEMDAYATKLVKDKYGKEIKESMNESTWALNQTELKKLEQVLDGLGNISTLDALKKKAKDIYGEWSDKVGDDDFYDELDKIQSAHELDTALEYVAAAARVLHSLETKSASAEKKRQFDALLVKKQRRANESRIMDFKTFTGDKEI